MTKLTQTIAFLGAGNMAKAIASGLLRAGLVSPEQLIAADISPEALAGFAETTKGARIAASNQEAAAAADIVILAVKPYQVVDVCTEISRADSTAPATANSGGGPLVISICAGIPNITIEKSLAAPLSTRSDPDDSTLPTAPLPPRVIRVMPNTPALIGAGSAAVASGRFATKDDLALAIQIFQSVGTAIAVNESKLDLVTGLTGSGPAYVFRFVEALLSAATEQGLTDAEAKTLVPQMVYGAAKMAIESTRPLHELRGAVTTKGGTTEAGLKVLEEGNFMDLISQAVAAAANRSKELSK